MSQNRAVIAKGTLLVLDVSGPKELTVELTVLLLHAVVPVDVG